MMIPIHVPSPFLRSRRNAAPRFQSLLPLLLTISFFASYPMAGQPFNTWIQTNGPYGGTINGIAVNPSNPNELILSTRFNGCIRSTNAGTNWLPVNQGLPSPEILCITSPIASGSTVFVGMVEPFGVYKSTNNGGVWAAANNGIPQNLYVQALRLEPASVNVLYAGTNGGIYKTTDGGRSWTAASSGLGSNDIRTIIIHPTISTTIFAGSPNGGLFKSTNGGSSWTASNTGIPSSAIVQNFAFEPSNPNTMYAATTGGMYRSVNGGTLWSSVSSGITNVNIRSIAITSASTLYIATGGGGVFKSTNGASTWTATNAGLTYYYMTTLAVQPGNTSVLYVAADDGDGLFKSVSSGGVWSRISNEVVATNVIRTASNINAVYAISSGNGIFRSSNKGTNWIAASSGIQTASVVNMLATDPSNPNTLYAASLDGVYKTTSAGLGTGAWTLKNLGLGTTNVSTITVHPSSTQTIYAGTSGGGIYRSMNGGESWSGLNVNIPIGSNVTAFAVAKSNPNVMYAGINAAGGGSDGVYRTNNGGVNWTLVVNGLGSGMIRTLSIDPANPSVVLAGTQLGMYRSTNGGDSWIRSGTGITTNDVASVVHNPNNRRIAYAATPLGVFRSVDEGVTWSAFNTGMFNTHVNDLSPDGGTPSLLFAGTYGSGVLSNSLAPAVGGQGTINFGAVTVNATSDFKYILANKGLAPLNVTSVTITGVNSSQFSILSGGGSFSLAEDEERSITVRFQPTSDGVKNATMRILSDAPGQSPFDVSLTGSAASPKISTNLTSVDFGNVAVGGSDDQSIKISNTGNAPLVISSQTITSNDADQFTIVQQAASTINPGLTDNIIVRFSPTSGGAKMTQLRLVSNASNEPTKDIQLLGTASGNPQITLGTNLLDFASVNIGATRELQLEISNPGDGTLSISSQTILGLDASQFSISQSAATVIRPGDKTSIKIVFQPTATGTKDALLRIVSNASNMPTANIKLSGTGSSAPLITVSDSKVDFGAVNIGGQTERSITVSNNGAAPLSITAQSITGADASQYLITKLSRTPLGTGESDLITVRFLPTSAGSKSALLRVVSNAGNAPTLDISLGGIGGGVPAIELTANELDFGGVALNVTTERSLVIRNSGAADLNITGQSLSGTDAAEFSIARTLAGVVPAGQADSLLIRFTPVSLGPKSAMVRVTSNAVNLPSADITLTGTGGGGSAITLSNENIDFGAVVLGGNTSQSITVSNSGSNPLIITEQSITGTDASSFAVSKQSTSPLQPGGSDDITISFSPASSGTKSAQLKIVSNAGNTPTKLVNLSGVGGTVPAISTSASKLEFGTISTGSTSQQSLTITNSGLSTLTISGQTLFGPDASEFSIVKQCTGTLSIGASDLLTVRFQPLSNGSKTATLRITSDAGNIAVLDISISGSAGAAPVITLNSSSLDFGLVEYGSSNNLTLTVSNSGAGDLSIVDQQISGSHASEFAILRMCSDILTPGQTDTVQIRFEPQRNGARTAQLLIASNDPNPLRDTMIVNLLGTGQRDEQPPQITHTPSTTAVQIGANVPIEASASDLLSGISRVELYYRTGSNPWNEVNRIAFVNGSAEIPGSFVTSEGLDYKIIAEDNAGNTDTSSYGEATFYSVPVIVPASAGGGLTTPAGSTAAAYRIFSPPFRLNNKRPSQVLYPLGAYNQRLWRFYEYRNGHYEELREWLVDSTRIVPGKGFFLITRNATTLPNTDGITLGAADAVNADAASFPGWQLQAGWNIIGNPFGFDIGRSSLRMQNLDTLRDVWYFNGGWVQGDTLKRFEGLAVRVASATTLRLVENALGGFNAAPAPNRFSRTSGGDGWRLQLIVQGSGMTDAENYVGVRTGASEDLDAYDRYEPPLLPGGAALFFESDGDFLSSDMRASGGDGYVWRVEVQCDAGSFFKLSCTGLEELPAGFRALLLDPAHRIAREVDAGTSLSFISETGVRRFQLLVGRDAFITQHSDGYDKLPATYRLQGVFPNPFATAAVIRYRMPAAAFVRIDLYDVLGRRIATPVSAGQNAGSYEIPLDGESLPPGLYIVDVRMQGEDGSIFHETKRIIRSR